MDVINRISEIRDAYRRDRWAFISGHEMQRIVVDLGAAPSDLESLTEMGGGLAEDPTLPFRRSRCGRFAYDYDRASVERLEFQPFVLTDEEDFVRHDSGQLRRFAEVAQAQYNTVTQALLRFNAFVISDVTVPPRPLLDYTSKSMICTLFTLRTITTPQLLGEPALEGVHTDGVDHTMTTFIDGRNLAVGSGVTRLHDMGETTGVPWDRTDPSRVLSQVQHSAFLDTLLVVDNERKHSVTPVHALNPGEPATRDMMIFFSRRPAAEGHVSRPYDSMARNVRYPLSVPMLRSTFVGAGAP